MNSVWRRADRSDLEPDTLLPRGRDWLKGRDDEPEWTFVWQKLIDQNFEPDTLLPRGRDPGSRAATMSPEWAFVWRKLIDQNFEPNTLLPHRARLAQGPPKPAWFASHLGSESGARDNTYQPHQLLPQQQRLALSKCRK